MPAQNLVLRYLSFLRTLRFILFVCNLAFRGGYLAQVRSLLHYDRVICLLEKNEGVKMKNKLLKEKDKTCMVISPPKMDLPRNEQVQQQALNQDATQVQQTSVVEMRQLEKKDGEEFYEVIGLDFDISARVKPIIPQMPSITVQNQLDEDEVLVEQKDEEVLSQNNNEQSNLANAYDTAPIPSKSP
eukprot:TRINITY_DN9842_c1_g1_i1.p1 TRINITY_DN9842_c1_g1~~TRINITY_DN9842_c1_g1_i1.p1  ORF type:complete len:186 (-),score=22.92 TRINITY_DN9842_c1_g1_i1:833-1390(-)